MTIHIKRRPGKEIYKMLWTKRLEMCYTGGGFPNPSTERFLEETGHCPNGVEEGWGSYENWDIGFGDNNVYNLSGPTYWIGTL